MEERAVETEQAKQYAEANGMLFNEASAKTGENVLTLFASLANKIHQDILQERNSGAS